MIYNSFNISDSETHEFLCQILKWEVEPTLQVYILIRILYCEFLLFCL